MKLPLRKLTIRSEDLIFVLASTAAFSLWFQRPNADKSQARNEEPQREKEKFL